MAYSLDGVCTNGAETSFLARATPSKAITSRRVSGWLRQGGRVARDDRRVDNGAQKARCTGVEDGFQAERELLRGLAAV